MEMNHVALIVSVNMTCAYWSNLANTSIIQLLENSFIFKNILERRKQGH